MAASLREYLQPALNAGLLDETTADRVRKEARKGGSNPLRTLSLHGRIPVSTIFHALAREHGLEFIQQDRIVFNSGVAESIPSALLVRRHIIPIETTATEIIFATSDISNVNDSEFIEALRSMAGKSVRFALGDPDRIKAALDILSVGETGTTTGNENAVQFIDMMIHEAFIRRATDIHLEPHENGHRIRLRIDGELILLRENIPFTLAAAVMSRLKVLSRMDIAESREPQDGSFKFPLEGDEGKYIDIRIASAPTKHGERATLRLLGTDSKDLTLEELGFSPEMYAQFKKLIKRPSGLVLLTGPTGSGKTTTLYAGLREINRIGINIMTVEDPVEYLIPGVSQLEVDDVGKVTFASALRALLRHDPDVMMIGEIRDQITADIALRSAATGHLVLSTLHTNTAIGAVTRLVDMGCEPFMVAATLIASISQRLVRRICQSCRKSVEATVEEKRLLNVENHARSLELHVPGGCVKCQGIGYYGRLAISEFFSVNAPSREAISSGMNETEIARAGNSLMPMRNDAAAKVLKGLTSMDEMRRIVVLED